MLERLCQQLGIPNTEALAIGDVGDSLNDLSMLDGRLGFRSAAPSNAENEVKEAVRAGGGYVAKTSHASGVAESIAYYLGK